MLSFPRLTTLLFATMLTSCLDKGTSNDVASTPVDTAAIATEASHPKVVERFFPSENVLTITDSTDQATGITVSITERTLDTYVINEHASDSIKYVDKYRDAEWLLKVSRKNVPLLDTVLRKETFRDHMDDEFMDMANFHGYWIRSIQPDQIEFFGVITKPETDWSFAFYHTLNLNNRQFDIKEPVDEPL